MTTTTAITPQAVETACDECAGDGQLAYDLEATMWVPRSATADWPADDCIGISVLDCLQCDGTEHRCGSIRDAAIVRQDPAGNSAPAWGSSSGSLSDTWKPEVRLSTAELT